MKNDPDYFCNLLRSIRKDYKVYESIELNNFTILENLILERSYSRAKAAKQTRLNEDAMTDKDLFDMIGRVWDKGEKYIGGVANAFKNRKTKKQKELERSEQDAAIADNKLRIAKANSEIEDLARSNSNSQSPAIVDNSDTKYSLKKLENLLDKAQNRDDEDAIKRWSKAIELKKKAEDDDN